MRDPAQKIRLRASPGGDGCGRAVPRALAFSLTQFLPPDAESDSLPDLNGTAGVLLQGGGEQHVELKQSAAIMNWFHTLKGAESFLHDADAGKLPAKSIVPQDFNSVENLLKRTKEQVHREATRLHSLEPKTAGKMPYGARKVALMTAPGEENEEASLASARGADDGAGGGERGQAWLRAP
ncbi:hypothetical protein T484DRAFT_1781437 [Baffinella frigidus]|nr:hypothetical protein T484DRAFT_1781437 [Cryptophyta sp. CCMP2293]